MSSLFQRRCRGIHTKSGKQCNNSVMLDLVGPQSDFCARHLVKNSESLYSFCSVRYQSRNKVQRCREIVLKRFGVCYKHFDTYLNSLSSGEEENLLKNTLQYLHHQASLISSLMKSTIPNSPEYHRKYKLSKKFESMISQTETRLNVFTRGENIQPEPIFKNVHRYETTPEPKEKPLTQTSNQTSLPLLPNFTSFVLSACPSILNSESEQKEFKVNVQGFQSIHFPLKSLNQTEIKPSDQRLEYSEKMTFHLPPIKWFPE